MTQSTPTEAWLKEASEKYADTRFDREIEAAGGPIPHPRWECSRDDFLAGAQWQRECPAPDEQELDHPCKQTCSGWKQGYERGCESVQAELEEQARLNGMGSEREAKLQAENERLRKALKVAWAWIKERRDVSFGNMEGADGPEFKQWEELYSISCKALEEIRKAREGKE